MRFLETLTGLNINISNNNNTHGIYTSKSLNIDDLKIDGYGYGITVINGATVNLDSLLNISTNTGVFIPENQVGIINIIPPIVGVPAFPLCAST